MSNETIEVWIAPDGSVVIHVQGVKGTSCSDITQLLEMALGATIYERQYTIEYYEAEEINEVVQHA